MIPIRLDIDMQGRRLRDAFLWDEHNELCTPEIFASRLVCDEGLPRCFASAISKSIRRQVYSSSSRQPHNNNSLTTIVLDIVIGEITYHDVFQWDSSSSSIMFAKKTCKDLKLPGSFEAAIAYAIEERIRRPRHSRSIGTISPTTSVSKLNKSELARVKRERLIQTKTSTTKSYEENLEHRSDPMVVKWVRLVCVRFEQITQFFKNKTGTRYD